MPLSAIPCFQYKKELEKEKQLTENSQTEATNLTPIAKVETLESNKKEKLLDSETILQYCKNLFEFKNINVQKFK